MILKYIVDKNCKYSNIRQVLKNEFNMSNRLISKLKINNKILLNGCFTFPDKLIETNSIIECLLDLEENSDNIVPTKIELNIIYEDDSFLVVNKSPGIAIHPSILHYDSTLSNGVKYYFESINLKKKIRPVNRLDKDTSGIVIFAKNEYIQECLIKQMKDNIFSKEYIAILDGILDNEKGTINAPISRKENSIIERCVNFNGDSAITHYSLIETFNNLSLVKFILETGRTHQIRVHSKYIDHPILGDTLYGESSPLINRQALHSYKVSFIHPITKNKLILIAPIPNDIKNIYEKR